ncbi:sulfite exporter TauE/SafE family protein [Flagellimonas meridianipacifica]|uniref:Probable membrane transporter protein n=1 Tax=Flagellimonas meridianipacifica TaxID=1080225 RepID=A0A2T0M8J3_9FLAO|nr:sulfite exporter TauE/SafE family protein [Allomuricauda pacifica]PRX53821.1 putative membrane protein YfcA [Allomuricauda pacifica]
MTLSLFIILCAVGLLNGFYSGLMGTGGNIILIPALDLVLVPFGFEDQELVKYIIAHSLFITVFNGFAVVLKHYRIKNLYPKKILFVGIPAALTAFLVSEWIKTSAWYSKLYFDILFLFLVLTVCIQFLFFKPKIEISASQQKIQDSKWSYPVLGSFTGMISALSGFGGGIVLIPALTDIFGIPFKRTVSVSIGVVMLLALSVSISYLNITSDQGIVKRLPIQFGYISLGLVGPILLGIFLSAPWGVRLGQKMETKWLRLIFGLVMVVLFLKTLFGVL